MVLEKIEVANLCQAFKVPLIWPLIGACPTS